MNTASVSSVLSVEEIRQGVGVGDDVATRATTKPVAWNLAAGRRAGCTVPMATMLAFTLSTVSAKSAAWATTGGMASMKLLASRIARIGGRKTVNRF